MEQRGNNKLPEHEREEISQKKHIEDKQDVCEKLCKTLKVTRDFKTLVYLQYEKKKNIELVKAIFEDRQTILINVTCDSEFALIKDVIKELAKNL